MDVICEEAKKLGVDVVLTLYLDLDRNYLNATAFVVNASKKKAYAMEGRAAKGDYFTIPNMLKRVFESYGKDR